MNFTASRETAENEKSPSPIEILCRCWSAVLDQSACHRVGYRSAEKVPLRRISNPTFAASPLSGANRITKSHSPIPITNHKSQIENSNSEPPAGAERHRPTCLPDPEPPIPRSPDPPYTSAP